MGVVWLGAGGSWALAQQHFLGSSSMQARRGKEEQESRCEDNLIESRPYAVHLYNLKKCTLLQQFGC